MATTTNYGWTTPDDTALVKDGAAAIRTLGSSVDTTTKALNPSTTLGDIEYRSSTANTNTRLGIGSTGNVLTVAGGVPTWAAPAGGGRGLNQIIPTSVAVGSGTATVGANGMITCTAVGTSLSVNGCFSSTYTNYLVQIDAVYSASYTYFDLRLRASGTDNSTASSYVYQTLLPFASTVATQRVTANRFQESLAISADVSAASISFWKPFTTDKTGLSIGDQQFARDGAFGWTGNGSHNQTTSYDGFTMIDSFQSGGGATFTGKVRIYGWME
jgi:hypothetical protein